MVSEGRSLLVALAVMGCGQATHGGSSAGNSGGGSGISGNSGAAGGGATTSAGSGSSGGRTSTLPPLDLTIGSKDAAALQIDLSHGGLQRESSLTPPLVQRWVFSLPHTQDMAFPLVVDSRVFALTFDPAAKLTALDAATGDVLWGPVAAGAPCESQALAYDSGRVFANSGDGSVGSVAAFDAGTGELVWQAALGERVGPPSAGGGLVFVGASSGSGSLHALDAATGESVWQRRDSAMWDVTSPLVTSGAVYANYCCDSFLALEPRTGEPLWSSVGSSFSSGFSVDSIYAGRIYHQPRDTNIQPVILDASNGRVVGSYQGKAGPAFADDSAFFIDRGKLVARELPTLTDRWTASGDAALDTTPLVINGHVYAGSSASGMVAAFDLADGHMVWFDFVRGGFKPFDFAQGVSFLLRKPIGSWNAGADLLLVPAVDRLVAWGSGDGPIDVLPPNGERCPPVPPAPEEPPDTLGLTASTRASSVRTSVVIAKGDFDGNGRTDVALVGNRGATDLDHLVVMFQRCSGGFALPVDYGRLLDSSRPQTRAAGVGDLNGDGRDDLAFATESAGLFAVYQQASGGLGPAVPLGIPTPGTVDGYMRVIDANGDGRSDILYQTYRDITMYLQTESGELGMSRQDDVGDFKFWGDFNQDGLVDAVLTLGGTGFLSSAQIAFQQSPGVWGKPVEFPLPVESGGLRAVADVTGDGLDDLVMQHGASELLIYPQSIDGGFAEPLELVIPPSSSSSREIVVADMDRNGFMDLVLSSNRGAIVFRQTAQDSFASDEVIAFERGFWGGGSPSAVVDDFDGDGMPDVAMTEEKLGLMQLLTTD